MRMHSIAACCTVRLLTDLGGHLRVCFDVQVKSMVVLGEWRDDNSGGCDLHPVWKKNPRGMLVLGQPARTK